jgi:uncharacterized Zn finger protein (UPF0148 family)
MMQGYSLTEQQCEKCSMPQVEYEGKLECAVCPALEKRALKSREKEQMRLGLEAEKKRLADQKQKIEEEISLRRIADSEKVKVEQEAEKQRLIEQEAEKQRLIEQQAQAEKQQLTEQDQKSKLDEPGGDQGSVKSKFEGVRTIRRTPRSTPTPMISATTEVGVRTIRRTPRSTPTPMVENHDSLLQVAAQPFSFDPRAIAPPSPTKVVELEAEEARLLAELQKAEEEKELNSGNDVFRKKEAKINEAIMKGNQLLLQETKRLHELQKHRMEAMQMPAKGMHADLSAQEQRKMREKEAMLRKEIEAAEQARDEAQLEARRLADEKRAMEEARLLVALEEEATTRQQAAEKALEDAKAASDHVASARRDILAKTIADGAADAVAEAESITRAEREDYYEQVILPTASALRRESWETLRAEGRSVMTRRVMAGWTLLPDFCRGAECESSPLLCKHATKMCVVCGGDGSGTNGAYSLVDDDEMDFDDDIDDDMTKDSTIRPPLEISTYGAIAPVAVEIDASETKRNMVCKSLIGKRMLEGWTLIDMACPHCVMPLMTTPAGIGEVCVLCGPVILSNEDENPVEMSKETQAVGSVKPESTQPHSTEAQAKLDPQKQPFSLSSRIKQLDTKVERSFVNKAQSSRIKHLGTNVESALVKKAQSLSSKKVDKSVSSPSNLEQSQSLTGDKPDRKRRSVSSRIKQYLSAAVGKNALTKGKSVASAEPETEQTDFTTSKEAKSVSNTKLDALEKSISSRSRNSYSTRDSIPSRVKQSNSSAGRFLAKSDQSAVSVKLDEQQNSVSSEVEQPNSTTGKSIATMAQSVAMVAQLIVSDKQDGQEHFSSPSTQIEQSNFNSEKGAVDELSEASVNLDDEKRSFSSKIKQYLSAVETLVESQDESSSKNGMAPDSITENSITENSIMEIPAAEVVKSTAGASSKKVAPDSTTEMPAAEAVKKTSSTAERSVGKEAKEAQPVESAQYVFPQSLDSLADEYFSKDDQSFSSSHAKDDRYAPLHASASESSVKGVSGRFESKTAIAEEGDEAASPYYRPAHLFTTTKSLYRNQSPRTRGDPPALQGHTTRRSNAVDPEDSRISPGRLHSQGRREPDVEENKNRIDIKDLPEVSPEASLVASPKQTPTDSPGEPPNDSDSSKEPATQTSKEARNGTENMSKILPKQTQAPSDSPGEPPKDSAEIPAEGSQSDTEQMAKLSLKQMLKESLQESPKEARKAAPEESSTGTSVETYDFTTKDSATTQRQSNRLFDRIEFIKERREKALARKLQINASNDESESEQSHPTIMLEMPAHSSRRLSNSARGRDAPPLGIDTGASVHRSIMHLPSPGMTEASFPKPFSSPGAASDRSSIASTTPSRAMSAPRPRITPESVRPRSSSRQRGEAAAGSRNEPPSASTKSTPLPGLPRKVTRDVIPGKFRGHSKSKRVQPEVIVIGGPFHKQAKGSSTKALPASTVSSGDDASSMGSSTLDALLNRIEETKAQLEEAPNTTNRLEQQARLKSLVETLTAAADEMERKELDCLSE